MDPPPEDQVRVQRKRFKRRTGRASFWRPTQEDAGTEA